jgi:hypothetical protein
LGRLGLVPPSNAHFPPCYRFSVTHVRDLNPYGRSLADLLKFIYLSNIPKKLNCIRNYYSSFKWISSIQMGEFPPGWRTQVLFPPFLRLSSPQTSYQVGSKKLVLSTFRDLGWLICPSIAAPSDVRSLMPTVAVGDATSAGVGRPAGTGQN